MKALIAKYRKEGKSEEWIAGWLRGWNLVGRRMK